VSDLGAALAAHRAAIRAVDRSAMAQIMAAYQDVLDRLTPLIELAQQQALADGVATPAQLFRLERWQELQRQTAVELERLARITGDVTTEAQARAVQLSLTDNLAFATAIGAQAQASVAAGWTHLPTTAVEDLVGLANNGPLRDLLNTFGDDGMRFITDELVKGIALGQSPRTVARSIEQGLEISRNRALTISRTEMMRAHRSATLRNYQANDDILKGWYWVSAHSARTCAACLAMDGTLHPLSESMDSHVACRCAKRPALKHLPARTVEDGETWLARQDAATQDNVLGKSGGMFYRAGAVDLQHFVKVDESPVWGRSVTDGGIGWALAQAGRGRRAA
jgi:SPP1 gp7 family putative phage head morphogenesis protein